MDGRSSEYPRAKCIPIGVKHDFFSVMGTQDENPTANYLLPNSKITFQCFGVYSWLSLGFGYVFFIWNDNYNNIGFGLGPNCSSRIESRDLESPLV